MKRTIIHIGNFKYFPSRAKPLTAPRPVTPSNQVTDDEYAKIVNKRRQEYGGFIVGEDGDE